MMDAKKRTWLILSAIAEGARSKGQSWGPLAFVATFLVSIPLVPLFWLHRIWTGGVYRNRKVKAWSRLGAWRDIRKMRQFKLENPYRMLPADDGGESYRMECTVCLEEGSIMGKFIHDPQCPAGQLEEKQFAEMRRKEKESR